MAEGKPLVVLLRTGRARPTVSELLSKHAVHSQTSHVLRAERTVEARVHSSHFTVHVSALV